MSMTPNAVHIYVLKERRPCAGLEDIEVFGIQVFRMLMTDVWSEHRGKTCMMVLGQPQRKDVELVVAGEHGVKG